MLSFVTEIKPLTASTTCVPVSVTQSSNIQVQQVGASCLDSAEVVSGSMVEGSVSSTCCTPYQTNWIKWNKLEQADWLEILPNYTVNHSIGSGEVRSSAYLLLQSQKNPTTIFTFPLVEGTRIGNPNKCLNLVQSGTNLTYTVESGSFPVDTNIEALEPNFVVAYQTDKVTGPSEKILLNIKRLRSLGFDKFKLTFGGFWIINFPSINSIPLEVKLFSGGYPIIIETDTNDPPSKDWNIVNGKLLFSDTSITAKVSQSANSSLTENRWMELNLTLTQNLLNIVKL